MTIIRSVKLASYTSIIALLVIGAICIITSLFQIKNITEMTQVLFQIQKEIANVNLLQKEVVINERNLLVFIGMAEKQQSYKSAIDSTIEQINHSLRGIGTLSVKIKELSNVSVIIDSANMSSQAYKKGIENVASQLMGDFALDAATANAMLFPYKKHSDLFKSSIKSIDSLVTNLVNSKRDSTIRESNIVIILVIFFSAAGLLLSLIISIIVIGQLKKGFSSTISQMRTLSAGNADLEKRIQYSSDNEIGILTKSINSFMDFFQRIIENVASVSETIKRISIQLSDATETLTLSSTKTVDVSTNITQASLSGASNIKLVAGKTTALVSSVVTISGALQSVNNAMTTIVEQCKTESEISAEANLLVTNAAQLINQLDSVTTEIGEIVLMIDTVAKQTRLLAINATIEASSAGEAGKGFAVVASEVKVLAGKTALATSNIDKKIKDVQNASNNVSLLIRKITEKINAINNVTDSIVSGVNKESSSIIAITENINNVNESAEIISSNVNDNAKELNEISKNITDVESVAKQNSTKVRDIRSEITSLNRMAVELERIVNQFEINKS